MTTSDKLTHIKAHHELQANCNDCKLESGHTCPRKNWNQWTDEEIATAYAILTFHSPSYSEEQLEWAERNQNSESKPVDAEPVKHGHWINQGQACNGDYLVRCSVCKRAMSEYKQIGFIRHYCPNCGAKMEGEVDE